MIAQNVTLNGAPPPQNQEEQASAFPVSRIPSIPVSRIPTPTPVPSIPYAPSTPPPPLLRHPEPVVNDGTGWIALPERLFKRPGPMESPPDILTAGEAPPGSSSPHFDLSIEAPRATADGGGPTVLPTVEIEGEAGSSSVPWIPIAAIILVAIAIAVYLRSRK